MFNFSASSFFQQKVGLKTEKRIRHILVSDWFSYQTFGGLQMKKKTPFSKKIWNSYLPWLEFSTALNVILLRVRVPLPRFTRTYNSLGWVLKGGFSSPIAYNLYSTKPFSSGGNELEIRHILQPATSASFIEYIRQFPTRSDKKWTLNILIIPTTIQQP